MLKYLLKILILLLFAVNPIYSNVGRWEYQLISDKGWNVLLLWLVTICISIRLYFLCKVKTASKGRAKTYNFSLRGFFVFSVILSMVLFTSHYTIETRRNCSFLFSGKIHFPPTGNSSVCVAKMDISKGTKITQEHISYRKIPNRFKPRYSYSISESKLFKGEITTKDIKANYYFSKEHFVKKTLGLGLQDSLNFEAKNFHSTGNSSVCVAKMDIPKGTKIMQKHIFYRKIPNRFKPKNSYSISESKLFEGGITTKHIKKGYCFLKEYFVKIK